MKSILFVVANPQQSALTKWETGFWLSELAHPYWEFKQRDYTITVGSPKGGPVKFDAVSDPENANGSGTDFVSLGFKLARHTAALLENTPPLSAIRVHNHDAIFVVGGLSPMLTFFEDAQLHALFAEFYEARKIAAAICHGTCILLNTRLSTGELLVRGKRWTGFTNADEDIVDKTAGTVVEPFRIESEARTIEGTTFVAGQPFAPHAVRDGNLITGQQGNSGVLVAKLMIEALQEDTRVWEAESPTRAALRSRR